MLYACMKSIFLIILIMCGAGDNVKLVIFCTCFLTREMLVQLVNFEKWHIPLQTWLSKNGTVSTIDVGTHQFLNGTSTHHKFFICDKLFLVKQFSLDRTQQQYCPSGHPGSACKPQGQSPQLSTGSTEYCHYFLARPAVHAPLNMPPSFTSTT
jgi:hypothetical protein